MTLPRRKAVALRHVAFEDLGLLAPLLECQGWDVTLLEAATADLADASVARAEASQLIVASFVRYVWPK